ncbi:MAG TPA: MerR family transcriptional regulator [Terriglobales bacterium]|nr:MerR family transcriptional regulator [Terriglobales bacterium]
MQPTFTSREVVALSRISLRQLQWWDEQGIVVPARQGHRRIYSRDDLAEVAVICELRKRGFSLQKIRRVIRFVQKEVGKRLVETVTAASEYHLLTDGRHIYLEDSARGVVDLLKNARQPMLTVCLSDAIQRVLSPVAGAAVRSKARAASSRHAARGLRRRPPARVAAPAGRQKGFVRSTKERGSKAS